MLGDRPVSIVKELTKKHETNFQTTLGGAIAYYEEQEPRGEYVLVIEGADRTTLHEEEVRPFLEMTIPEHVNYYVSQGMDKKTAMKQAAKDRGVSKRDIYQALLE